MGVVGFDSILGAVAASSAGQVGHSVHCDVIGFDPALVSRPDSVPVVASLALSMGQAGHASHTHGVVVSRDVVISLSLCEVVTVGESSDIKCRIRL